MEIENWSPAQLEYEIARALADYVVAQADQLRETNAPRDSDTEARRIWRKQRTAIRASTDWLDTLISERLTVIEQHDR